MGVKKSVKYNYNDIKNVLEERIKCFMFFHSSEDL